MEPTQNTYIPPTYSTPASNVSLSPLGVCPTCHQPVLPEYYFCPNCGTKLNSAPLSTTTATQVGLYAFSIVLPMICFLFVTRWQGVKYYKSQDPKAQLIGRIAWGLLILSTMFTIWLAVVGTQALTQSTINGINQDFGM